MAKRPRHPDKDIEVAVKYAESKGWTWTASRGHAWACCGVRSDSEAVVASECGPHRGTRTITRRFIRRQVDRCPH